MTQYMWQEFDPVPEDSPAVCELNSLKEEWRVASKRHEDSRVNAARLRVAEVFISAINTALRREYRMRSLQEQRAQKINSELWNE